MADGALHRLAIAARRHERFTLLDAAGRHVGRESDPPVAERCQDGIVRHLDDALTDRLHPFAVTMDGGQHPAALHPGLRDGRGLGDRISLLRQLRLREVVIRLLHFGIRRRHDRRDHS